MNKSYKGYKLHDIVVHCRSGMEGRVIAINIRTGYITVVWDDCTCTRHGNGLLPISDVSLLYHSF